MAAISRSLRSFVTHRAHGLCEYCHTSQKIVIEMEVDHVVPVSAGGLTTEDNLCLACASCNNYKGAAQSAYDPETGEDAFLFNPRLQNWYEHFQWDAAGTQVIGITPVGRATIERLKINRKIAVEVRERWVKAGWHPPHPAE